MDQRIIKLINKFFEGQCSEEEKKILDNWYNAFDKENAPSEMIDPVIRGQYEKMTLKKIDLRIAEHEEGQLKYLKPRHHIFKSFWVYGLTAAAAMLLIAIVIHISAPKDQFLQANTGISKNPDTTYLNNAKNLKKITLPDGSYVWLNPNSDLKVPLNFGKASRNVRLEGQAFFQVTKNEQMPFIIATNSIITKVWGTSFTVNAYPHSGMARVSVLTGKVSVSLNRHNNAGAALKDKEMMLFPNQNATYFSGKQSLLKNIAKYNNEDLNIWKKVNLSFHNEKMSEVIKRLNLSFNVNITADEPQLNSYLLIADLSDQDLPSILDVLKASLNIRYEINKNEITLRSN